jgi:hypothetical protein
MAEMNSITVTSIKGSVTDMNKYFKLCDFTLNDHTCKHNGSGNQGIPVL